jgi:hypothetical protein
MWRLRICLDKLQRTVGKINELEMGLSGRRGAPGAMQRKGIVRSHMLRERERPDDNLRCTDQVQRGCRQRGHVQRLANMACGVRTLTMFMQETAARREIQQRGASQKRQSPAHNRLSEHDLQRIHNTIFTLAPRLHEVENRCQKGNNLAPIFLDPATIPL